MTVTELDEAREEAKRFLKSVGELFDKYYTDGATVLHGSPESADVKRKSMDLTKALVKLRRRKE